MNINANHSESTSANYSANESAVSFHDVPSFATDAFFSAADAMNYWVGQHTIRKNETADGYAAFEAASGRSASPEVKMRLDLALYCSDSTVVFDENLMAAALVQEILAHTVAEVHALPVHHRGHYLAQLCARWYSDGTLDPLRFRVAHMLSTYFDAMPGTGYSTGLLEECPDDMTFIGWSTVHGDIVDVVTVAQQAEDFTKADIATALEIVEAWGPRPVAGVRYLPLEEMTEARFYFPDGSWEPLRERSTVGSP